VTQLTQLTLQRLKSGLTSKVLEKKLDLASTFSDLFFFVNDVPAK
jgi:hypothetical protein